jgi:hypothetical protein
MPSLFIQKPVGGTSQTRLSLALLEVFARTRSDWYFQPQLLRRDSGCPRPSRAVSQAKNTPQLITKNDNPAKNWKFSSADSRERGISAIQKLVMASARNMQLQERNWQQTTISE